MHPVVAHVAAEEAKNCAFLLGAAQEGGTAHDQAQKVRWGGLPKPGLPKWEGPGRALALGAA